MADLEGTIALLLAVLAGMMSGYLIRAIDGVPAMLEKRRAKSVQRQTERLAFARERHRSVESYVLESTLRLVAFAAIALMGIGAIGLCVIFAPSPLRELMAIVAFGLMMFSAYLISLLADSVLTTAADFRNSKNPTASQKT